MATSSEKYRQWLMKNKNETGTDSYKKIAQSYAKAKFAEVNASYDINTLDDAIENPGKALKTLGNYSSNLLKETGKKIFSKTKNDPQLWYPDLPVSSQPYNIPELERKALWTRGLEEKKLRKSKEENKRYAEQASLTNPIFSPLIAATREGELLKSGFEHKIFNPVMDFMTSKDKKWRDESSRLREQATNEFLEGDKAYQALAKQYPLGTTAGSIAPYLFPTQSAFALAGKAATRLGSIGRNADAMNLAKQGSVTNLQGAGVAVSEAIDLTKSSGVYRTGETLGRNIPLQEAGLAALYGQSHLLDDPFTSAAFAYGGIRIGNKLFNKYQIPGKSNVNKQEEALNTWYTKQGGVVPTGTKTGNVESLRMDYAMEVNDTIGAKWHDVVTSVNELTDNRIILRAFNLGGDEITAENMKIISRQLGKEYDEVLKTGKVDAQILKRGLDEALLKAKGNMTPDDFGLVQKQVNKLREAVGSYNAGKVVNRGIIGTEFQATDRHLRTRIANETAQGNIEVANSLMDVRRVLQKSMVPSMGKDGMKTFNELNYKWALKSSVEGSLDSSGRIDMEKLSRALSKDGGVRYALGKTNAEQLGRVYNIEKLAKFHTKKHKLRASLQASGKINKEFEVHDRMSLKDMELEQYMKGLSPKASIPFGLPAKTIARPLSSVALDDPNSIYPATVAKQGARDLMSWFEKDDTSIGGIYDDAKTSIYDWLHND